VKQQLRVKDSSLWRWLDDYMEDAIGALMFVVIFPFIILATLVMSPFWLISRVVRWR
jgi:hypothetical protein